MQFNAINEPPQPPKTLQQLVHAYPKRPARSQSSRYLSDVFFEIMARYLKPSETVCLTLACRHFFQISNSDYLWETVYKMQVALNQYLDDGFSPLIQNAIQSRQAQDSVYKRLCGLLAQGCIPWKVKATAGYPWLWEVLKGSCWQVAILSNGNIAMEGDLFSLASIWTPTGERVATLRAPDGRRFSLRVPFVPTAEGGVVTADLFGYSAFGYRARVWSAAGRLLTTLTGHTEEITCMIALPNGNIVTGSKDRTAIVWSLANMGLMRCVGHTKPVTCVVALSDVKIVTGSEDGKAIIWSLDNGARLATLVVHPAGHRSPITCMAVLLNGNIVTGYESGTLKIWSPDGVLITNLSQRLRPELTRVPVKCITVLKSGNFATAHFYSVYVWSPDGQMLATVRGHHGVRDIAPLPDGGFVTTGRDGNSHTVRVWSPLGASVAILKGHTENVSQVKVFPNGDILSASWDGTARIWTVDVESLVRTRCSDRCACCPIFRYS